MDPESKSSRRPYLLAKDRQSKKGRLVVRNVSYKADEDSIREFFQPFGEIQEIHILHYPDGRRKGPVFVQFLKVFSALKAIRDCNMKTFMGRPVAVDWAVPKEKYVGGNIKEEDSKDRLLPLVKLESGLAEHQEDNTGVRGDEKLDDISEVEVKKEESCSDHDSESEVENDDSRNEANMGGEEDDFGSEEEDLEDEEDDLEDEEDDFEDEEDDFEDEEDGGDSGEDEMGQNDKSKIRTGAADETEEFKHNPLSRDVMEGRSLFIRNLPFDATEDQLEQLLSQFGDLKYVLLCRDRITKRPRGTAFAQFMTKNASDNCLEAVDDPAYKSQFTLEGRRLIVSRAIGREEIEKSKTEKKKDDGPKDKRNLYLAREGVIREGTRPANDLSKTDLRLRTQREVVKRKMLANLNIFVSPVRLFVCNLPLQIIDKDLKSIFKGHCPKDAVITECKIMRNLFELDRQDKPVSKGHAFVTFTQHRHALEALRNINNNPSIFSERQRPVVEFSMENRAALNAKMKRLEKSKLHNKDGKKVHQPKTALTTVTSAEASVKGKNSPFMGANYDPTKKGKKALHSHIGPKIRHKDRQNPQQPKGKITRNKLNNQLRNARGVKRKRGGGPHSKQGNKAAKKDIKAMKKDKRPQKENSKNPKRSSKKHKSKKRKFI